MDGGATQSVNSFPSVRWKPPRGWSLFPPVTPDLARILSGSFQLFLDLSPLAIHVTVHSVLRDGRRRHSVSISDVGVYSLDAAGAAEPGTATPGGELLHLWRWLQLASIGFELREFGKFLEQV